MKNQKNWSKFQKSGKIADYLDYKAPAQHKKSTKRAAAKDGE